MTKSVQNNYAPALGLAHLCVGLCVQVGPVGTGEGVSGLLGTVVAGEAWDADAARRGVDGVGHVHSCPGGDIE